MYFLMVEKVRHILRFRNVMRRWWALSLRRRPERFQSGSGSVRAGFVAVYVGADRRRFVIPTRFLNLPVFGALLERAEEEYGSRPVGGLAFPCDADFFGWLLGELGRNEAKFGSLGLEAVSELFAVGNVAESSCRETAAAAAKVRSPLRQKVRA